MKKMNIPLIPEFPSQIKSAFELNKLAVFIGTDFSYVKFRSW